MEWNYEKMGDDYKIKHCPQNDADGKITGKCVIGLKAWFDENPEERKRLGWIKHYELTDEEIKAQYPHNPQSQYLVRSTRMIDPYTAEDVYHVMDKSEDQMLFEEMLDAAGWGVNNVTVTGGIVWQGW